MAVKAGKMAYLAYYRAFRPTNFNEVVRQEHIVRILKNQISTDKIGHAYLFCGPRGTGKTTLAKIFARAINCLAPQDGSPCGKCEVCRSLENGATLDIYEIDAASNNGVDEMRDLREMVQYPPVVGKFKVYIIDEVHMLTPSAFNAVLKTLEEPPRHAVFILATTEPQKIPATILSRCMRFDFKLLPQSDLESLIKSVFDKTGKAYEDAAVSAIVRAGAGSARDCLSIADTCASYSDGKLTYDDVNAVLGSAEFMRVGELCKAVLSEDCGAALTITEDILSQGKGVGVLIKDTLSFLNLCSIAKSCISAREIVNLPDEAYSVVECAANSCDGQKLLRVTEIMAAVENNLRYSSNAKITFETAVIRSARPAADYDPSALLDRIASLEKKLAFGAIAFDKKIENSSKTGILVGQLQKSSPETEKIQDKKPEIISAKIIEREREIKDKVAFEESAVTPFDNEKLTPPPSVEEQPSLFDASPVLNPTESVSEGYVKDKATVFAKFIRALRTTRRNAVLFTLCMDLDCIFEGERMILTTDSESVHRALCRPDNEKFIADVLLEFGVLEHEVRLGKAKESDFDKAVAELKKNFEGIDVNIK